jgi:spectinomycin phosphotransferase
MKVDNNFDKSELKALINAKYNLKVHRLTFIPEGEDSYCYLAQSESGEKYFVKAQSIAPDRDMEAILRLTTDLHTRCGLPSVVAPLPTMDGRLKTGWRDFHVAVFNFIEGNSRWDLWKVGEDFTEADMCRVGELFAEFHQRTEWAESASIPTEQFNLERETDLFTVLNAAEKSSQPQNRYQRQLLERVSTHRSEIQRSLERFEGLQKTARSMENPFVITHGDPSPGNIILDTENRLHIIDWDGIGFGPPEKDLVHFTDGGFEPFLNGYLRQFRPERLEVDIFAFYIYHWALCEIADFGTRILYQNTGDTQNAHDWDSLLEYLPPNREYMELGISKIARILNEHGLGNNA